jgi:Predicted metal-dependent hydrolase with the TIM-barrel fold
MAFEEDVKGTLTPGKLADVAVLSDNMLEGPPGRIRETTVDYTVVGGEVVYTRE